MSSSQISDLLTSSQIYYLMMQEEVPEETLDLNFFWRANNEMNQNEPQHREEGESMADDITDSQLAAFVDQCQQPKEGDPMADGISDSQIAAFANQEEQREAIKSHLPGNVLEELEHPFSTSKLSCTSHLRYNYRTCVVM
jgi:hypothetical protein